VSQLKFQPGTSRTEVRIITAWVNLLRTLKLWSIKCNIYCTHLGACAYPSCGGFSMSKSLGKYGDVSGRKSIPGCKYGKNLGGSGSNFSLQKCDCILEGQNYSHSNCKGTNIFSCDDINGTILFTFSNRGLRRLFNIVLDLNKDSWYESLCTESKINTRHLFGIIYLPWNIPLKIKSQNLVNRQKEGWNPRSLLLWWTLKSLKIKLTSNS